MRSYTNLVRVVDGQAVTVADRHGPREGAPTYTRRELQLIDDAIRSARRQAVRR